MLLPYLETDFGSSPSLIHFSMFLPTNPGIMRARPMQTALKYGLPIASALKTPGSSENPPAMARSGTR